MSIKEDLKYTGSSPEIQWENINYNYIILLCNIKLHNNLIDYVIKDSEMAHR